MDALIEWKQQRTQRRYTVFLTGLTLLLLAIAAAIQCDVNANDFATGLGKGITLLTLFVPPAMDTLKEMVQPALVTLLVALAASILGSLLSVPIALAAASNVAVRWLRATARFAVGVERGIPEIVILLFCVAVFGVGLFPALLALTVASAGMLAKLLADAIEEADPHTLDSVRATGATHSQVIRYGVVAQVLPSFLANSIFRFEVNVRASVLMGAVGAGGIGYELSASITALEYRRATVAIAVIVLIVFVSERISDSLRRRLLAGGRLQ